MFKSFIKIPLFFLNQKSIHFKAKELTFKLYKLVNGRVPLDRITCTPTVGTRTLSIVENLSHNYKI